MRKIRGKGKLFLYGMSGVGINMLNMIISSYLCDALMVEGFDKNVENWTYLNKTLIVAGVWSVMIVIAKIIDGVIDIPLAAWTDNLKTRWGKRRPAILIGMIPMIAAYCLFLIPLRSSGHSLLNTIWFGVLLCIFYTFYTLTMVTYYATFAEIVDNDEDRLALSNYKTVFDIVYYILGYALIPMFIGSANIRILALAFLPLSLSMLIPIFMIKEKSSLDKDVKARRENPTDESDYVIEEHVGLFKSFGYAVRNRNFLVWMLVFSALQFGLQMFITGMNVFYSGSVGLRGSQITIVMACALVPVPLTLILYNRIVKKHGFKTGYIASLAAFMFAMIIMFIDRAEWIPSATLRLILASVGCLIASFGIGCFFSVNYSIPSSLADMEQKTTGISHPAMFFAVQGLFSGIATAVSTGLVWVNLKAADNGAYVWVMPLIVAAACAVSLVATAFLSKEVCDIGKISKKDR